MRCRRRLDLANRARKRPGRIDQGVDMTNVLSGDFVELQPVDRSGLAVAGPKVGLDLRLAMAWRNNRR